MFTYPQDSEDPSAISSTTNANLTLAPTVALASIELASSSASARQDLLDPVAKRPFK